MRELLVVGDPGVPMDLLRSYVAGEHLPLTVVSETDVDRFRTSVEAIVTYDHEVGEKLLSRWPALQVVSCAFTGRDKVEVAEARKRGIRLYYVPGYSTRSVAELNLLLVFASLRNLLVVSQDVRTGHWRASGPGQELRGKCVAILGLGAIGLETATLFRALGCRLVGWSRNRKAAFTALGGEHVSREAAFALGDIVVLQMELNDDTRRKVGEEDLSRMKRGAILVVTSRMELVEKDALYNRVRSGAIRLGVDVFETEPVPPDEPLLQLPGVVATSHVGCRTDVALQTLARQAIQNIRRYYDDSGENEIVEELCGTGITKISH